MSQTFKVSDKLLSALKFFVKVAKEEKVPLADSGARGFTHLSPDFCRILSILELAEKNAKSLVQKQSEASSVALEAQPPQRSVLSTEAPASEPPVAASLPDEPPQAEGSQAEPAQVEPSQADAPQTEGPDAPATDEVVTSEPAELVSAASADKDPADPTDDQTPPQEETSEETTEETTVEATPAPQAQEPIVPNALALPPSDQKAANQTKGALAKSSAGVSLPPPPQAGGVRPFPQSSSGGVTAPIEAMKKTIYLKNARANEPYQAAVNLDGLKSVKLSDDGGSGLTFDETSGLLSGQPTVAGDFVLRFSGLMLSKRCEVTANLAVIPDPKSLWTSLDSDRSDPYWKPDEAFARIEGDLFGVAASKRGRSHAKDGTFRDDDFDLQVHGESGWHIAVVADGAGSAKYSRRGSKVAVDAVMGSLPALLDDHLTPHLDKLVSAYLQQTPGADEAIKSQLYQSLATSAFEAAKAIDQEALSKDEKASAFSTTLIIGVVRKLPQGWFIAAFSIGDGGAAVFDLSQPSVTPLTLPDNGEFAGQTRFLHKSEFAGGFPEVAKRLFFDIRQTFTAITLMTDGITDPKFPTDVVFADPKKWAKFWTDDLAQAVDFSPGNEDLEQQLLDWLDFWSPGNHDDRTLVVLVP